MATVTCPACGEVLSAELSACPKCGLARSHPPTPKKKSLGCLPILAIICLAVFGCTALIVAVPRPPRTETAAAPAKATAAAATDDLAEAPVVVPTKDATSEMWASFGDYGPKLAALMKRSNDIMALAVAGAVVANPQQRGQLYTMMEQGARGQATIARESSQVKVHASGNDVKSAIGLLARDREEWLNKAKEALDKPSASTESAAGRARAKAEQSMVVLTNELKALCDRMKSEQSECGEAIGWPS